MFFINNRIMSIAAAIGMSAIISPYLYAADDRESLLQQINEMKQQSQKISNAYQSKLDLLEDRLKQLEQQKAATSSISNSTASSPIQIGLSGLFAAGGSNADNSELEGLQAGGHDPNRNGFTVQNVELSIGATVDPYFDGQANIIFLIDSEGETVVELEEAFFTSRNLPWGLQVKGGQYFTEFGRQNPQHPHTWAFADQPVVLSRFFGGDGLRSQGLRVSWLAPTPWYTELYLGAQNSNGETVSSFLGEGVGEDPDEPEQIGSHSLIDRDSRDQSDLLYFVRWLNGFEVSDTLSMNLGFSGLQGPNTSGLSTDTQIIGTDIYLKWQPAYVQRGFPFVSWHTELLQRRYEAGDSEDPSQETLNDWGVFSQALWGFRPGWIAGLRVEFAESEGGEDSENDPLRDRRKRVSPNLTWHPTEYSKLRLQYNRDWANHLSGGTADSVSLQVEFSLGAHMAHIF
ncbi:MAG: hypothetical protein JKY67_20605 [Pseudomonadales bacterium]|nr:hypothetical protein [Pseudomonadales bacterium]